MGKSTTAQMFRDVNIPVYDADATVHNLYEGEAATLIEAAFPGTVKNGVVDRSILAQYVVGNEEAMKQLEAIIHPLVRREELSFRKRVESQSIPLAILDIPLLFETNSENRVDGIIVVTAPEEVQRQRVLERPGMDEKKFEAILNRQVADSIKRKQADFIIDTSKGMESARESVLQIIKQVGLGKWKKLDKDNA